MQQAARMEGFPRYDLRNHMALKQHPTIQDFRQYLTGCLDF